MFQRMVSSLTVRYAGTPQTTRVVIARGGLSRLGALTRSVSTGVRALIVSDTTVARLYAPAARRSLARVGFAVTLATVPPGERSKSPARLAALWGSLGHSGIGRGDVVVALGGGVPGDLAGFAAASWLRGIAWVAVPSTLLSMVDSALGGKTGIDLDAGKNLVGAFHHPRLVLADPALLATLPPRERRAGLAEVVKTGFATDRALFRWCERHAIALADGEPAALDAAVGRTLRAKARVVGPDANEREGGGRSALNFGHTLGHAYETARNYRGVRHGEAVAVGLRAAARLSERVAGLDPRERARLDALLDRLGLPKRLRAVSVGALLGAMRQDKKRSSRAIRWVLTPRMGHASVPRPIDLRLVRAMLIDCGARS